MEDMIRASELTKTMAKLKVLNEQLAKATADLSVWKIYASAAVTNNGGISVSVAKKDGSGFIHTISPEVVLTDSVDPETIIRVLVDEVFDRLLKEEIRNVLAEPVSRALKNAVTIQSKKS